MDQRRSCPSGSTSKMAENKAYDLALIQLKSKPKETKQAVLYQRKMKQGNWFTFGKGGSWKMD